MNWLLGAEIAAYAVWAISMIYHRRDVKDERGRMVVLKSNNFAYGVVLFGLSTVLVLARVGRGFSSHALMVGDAVIILCGLLASAVSMFVFNRIQ